MTRILKLSALALAAFASLATLPSAQAAGTTDKWCSAVKIRFFVGGAPRQFRPDLLVLR